MKKKPTEAELEILAVLWSNGPQTVRQIHDLLSKNREVFYTTTLKTMQVMTEKGLLERDTTNRSHIYKALLKKNSVARSMVNKLINTVFAGSAGQLVVSALGQSNPSKEELEEIKSLIEKIEKDGSSN